MAALHALIVASAVAHRGWVEREEEAVMAGKDERGPDGLGWGVYQILGILKVPPEARWRNEEWVEKLFTLKKKGVELEGMLAWAFHIAAMREANMLGRLPPMLDSVEMLERVASAMRAHSSESLVPTPLTLAPPELLLPGTMGVESLLGLDLPTAKEWNNYHWVKTLFELQERGVQLADFQAWGSSVAERIAEKRRVESIPVVDLSDDSSTGVVDSPETFSQEVDGPAGLQPDGNIVDGLRHLERKLEEAMKRELRNRFAHQ